MIPELGRRVAHLHLSDLTPAAKERLLLSLLGNISVGIAGPATMVVPAPQGPGVYRLLSGATAARADDAAFYNGAAMHARTQDDFDPIGKLHAGTVAIPALLAEADSGALAGKDFLAGLAAAYMISAALSHAPQAETTPRGWRATAIFAPFGAAAAVARARRVSAEHAASALAMTTAFVGGTTQAWLDGSDEWQLHTAQGARTAVEVNNLAAKGLRGGARALDGQFGILRAVAGRDFTWAEIEAALDPSTALENNTLKRYPASGGCQSIVLAAERAARKVTCRPDEISHIRVQMNPKEFRYPGHVNKGPFTAFGDRLMSAEMCAASVLAFGKFVFADFHAKESPVRTRLVELTEVVEDVNLSLLSARIAVMTPQGLIEEQVINSRAEVGLDWTTIDDWAASLWEEAGRTRSDYLRCRDAVLQLETAGDARLPL